MKNHKIGVIGCGMIYKSHVKSIASMENAEIVAVCDKVEKKAEAAGKQLGVPYFTDGEEMLKTISEIDVCLLLLPTYEHCNFIKLCASYGKAIVCEKPFTMTVAEAIEAKKAIEEAGVPYMTAQVVRFWTGYTQIKKMMDAGEFGDIYMAYFSRNSERQCWDNFWLFDPVIGGGSMFDMMVHDIDYMNYLFGPSKCVYGLASKDETGCYDNVFASVTYENGIKAVAETEFNMHTGYPFSMFARVMGTKAACELTYCAGFDINQRDNAIAELKIFREGQPAELINLDQYDPYKAEVEYFLDCIDKGIAPSVVTPADSLEVMRTVNAIKESADTNSVVFIKR